MTSFSSQMQGSPLVEGNKISGEVHYTPRCKIYRSKEALDIQSELIFVNGMVHLPLEQNFGTPTTLPSPTTHTTLTPHSNSQSDFPSYVMSCVQYTYIQNHCYVYWMHYDCFGLIIRAYVMRKHKSMPCYSQLINWCLAHPLRVKRF